MLRNAVKKTNSIVKMRILVEEVIAQPEIFKLLANEVPISVILQLDDIVIVCSVLTNLRKPIYC